MADLNRTVLAADVAEVVMNFDCGVEGNGCNLFDKSNSESEKEFLYCFVENLFFFCDTKVVRIGSL